MSALLSTLEMARFAARGFLRFDAIVPDALNRAFLDEVGHTEEIGSIRRHYAKLMGSSAIPLVRAGTPLRDAYPETSALARILALPRVAGAIESLVGRRCVVDHHFLHVTFPPALTGTPMPAQHTHQDSTIDPRRAFDTQIMYFPHAVTREMGGTRFVPGTHLRIVSEAAIARYQNVRGQEHVVCPAGTLLFMHHGIWHGGGANRSDEARYMFKIRLAPTERQCRLWDTRDLDTRAPQRPIFWTGGAPAADASPGDASHGDAPRAHDVHAILTTPEPWHEQDTGRLEYLNRIRFWRYLTGDDTFDADYWLTRIENEHV